MQLHELKTTLQQHLTDGLVTIVGSGLSCAEGLPSMTCLADHLCTEVGGLLLSDQLPEWQDTIELIQAEGLEAALLKKPPSPEVEAAVSSVTARLIADKERAVIEEVFSGDRTLRLTKLIEQLLKPSSGLPIITTNYDRLVEIAAEEAGLGVDTMFLGRFAGALNERESRMSFCRNASYKNKRIALHYQPRAIVCKPHGSLDWYIRGDKPVHFSGDLSGVARLIITPGSNKFRNGYDSPFDLHRTRANDSIDRASRFLILGYGFNDDHLETHLSPAIRSGKPSLLITHTLSPNARKLVAENANVISLEYSKQGGVDGTTVSLDKTSHFFDNLAIWDVSNFVSEVLVP